MKYLFSIVCLFLLINTTEAQKKVQWMTWEEAMTEAETNPKKIYVDVYTDWCGYCKKMDNTTFKDPKVVKFLNDNFYPVKFNAEQKGQIKFNNNDFNYISNGGRGVHELAYALLNGRLGYPAFVVLDETFARILISPGYKEADAVMMEMEFAKDEKYKTMAWATYQAQYMAAKNPATANPAVAANKNNLPSNAVDTKPSATKTNARNTKVKSDTIPNQGKAVVRRPPPPPPTPPAGEEDPIFKVVEQMPRFPGCEEIEGGETEKKKCSDEKLLQYVYKNLKYPDSAREKKIEGMVVLQFIVDTDGSIIDAKILREIGEGCGDEALKVINSMPKWTPGKQRGEPVKVNYTFPVRFKLENQSEDKMNTPKVVPKGKGK